MAITESEEDYYDGETGGYRYVPLSSIVNNFMVAYVGDGKLITDARRSDVIFHAKRGVQEFAYDISKVEKIMEIQIPSSLSIPMPQDFVSKVNLYWIDSDGIEHPIYEARFTSTPSKAPLQDGTGGFIYDVDGNIVEGNPLTEERFKANTVFGGGEYLLNDFEDGRFTGRGARYGLDPELSQVNGWYVVNEGEGSFSFSSDLVDKIVNLKYISDGLGTDAETQVHKFAEQAIYMHIAHAILSTMIGVQEYIVRRYKKDRFVSLRNAKLRLSKLNLIEMTQTMRGASKFLS
tara:strand:- start:29561 stop:30430 length:870 start_codon:yes stop_codon:yes gene_type:complete